MNCLVYKGLINGGTYERIFRLCYDLHLRLSNRFWIDVGSEQKNATASDAQRNVDGVLLGNDIIDRL
jgi:hypothetical protein